MQNKIKVYRLEITSKLWREAAKKRSSTNDQAIKRGEGVKGRAFKEKED